MSRDELTIVPPRGVDLPELPHSWAWTYLGAILTQIVAGKSFRCEERPPTESEYGVVKVSAVTWGTYNDGESKTITDDERINLDYIIRSGDFLFSRANTIELVGACVVVHETRRKLLLSDKILRFDFAGDFKSWINWMLKSRLGRRQIETLSTGNQESMRNIGQEQIRHICVPVPPINEQRRIVAKIEELFSELDKGVEALMTAREQLKAYRQALLKHAFEGKLTEDWRNRAKSTAQSPDERVERLGTARAAYYAKQVREWEAAVQGWAENGERGKRPTKPERPAEALPVSDDDVGSLPTLPKSWEYARLATLAQIGSGMSVSKDRSLDDPIDVPYLRVANVQRGRLDLAQMKTMKIEKTQLSQLVLKKWDVLFNEGGDRDKLGRGWVWEDQIHSCITQNHVFRASPYLASEMHAKFISYWGNTFGQEYFNTEGKQTTNLASINKRVLSAFPVPFPPMQEQAEVVREIEKRMSLYNRLQAEIEAALKGQAALRQSVLKLAFSGQLVAQDPRNEPGSVLLERVRAERVGTVTKKQPATKNGKKKAA